MRIFRSYYEIENSIFSFIRVAEPQSNSKLHYYALFYPSVTPSCLITQLILSTVLPRKVKSLINRTCTACQSSKACELLGTLKSK